MAILPTLQDSCHHPEHIHTFALYRKGKMTGGPLVTAPTDLSELLDLRAILNAAGSLDATFTVHSLPGTSSQIFRSLRHPGEPSAMPWFSKLSPEAASRLLLVPIQDINSRLSKSMSMLVLSLAGPAVVLFLLSLRFPASANLELGYSYCSNFARAPNM